MLPHRSTTPHVIVIAGPNGAGKTTAAPYLLRDTLGVTEFVNADTIAQGLSAFGPEQVAITAGRIMLACVHELADSVVEPALWALIEQEFADASSNETRT